MDSSTNTDNNQGTQAIAVGCETSTAVVAVSEVVDKTPSKYRMEDSQTPTDKYRGLQNQGATCYLNSLIQTLYMTPEFRKVLYSWDYKEAEDKFNKEYCIPLQLQVLFACLQTSKRKTVSTKGLTRSFNWQSNEVLYQQDIQEFCRVLFNAIEESFKAIDKPCQINDLYQGGMKYFLKCTECGYESSNFSEFMDLSLPIHDPWNNINNSSLEEALENYVKPEVLDEDNKYQCSGCDKKVRAVKGQIFDKLPEILVIQLNRFTFNMYGNAIKVNDKITFPYVLDMNKFMDEDVDSKIKQTEQRLMNGEFDQQKDDEQTPPDQEMENTENTGAIALGPTSGEETKDDKQDTVALEEQERENMGGEDPLDDPMNSLAGPKKVHYYGSPEDDQHVEFGATGETPLTQKIEDEHQQQLRKDQEILDEIDKNTKQYLQKGEWVYYLYSVLIHSGGVGGGHYSAYIKSFEDNTWYHFNDSRVSEINISQIESMHGDGHNSKNAYLVIYKKICNDPTAAPITVPDSEVPDYIQDEVKVDNDAFDQEERDRLELEALRKEQAAHITLRVFSKSHKQDGDTTVIYSNKVTLDDPSVQIVEKKFDFKNYQTLKEATEQAYRIYGYEEKGIKIEDVQLRLYSVSFKVLKQTFENKEDQKLEDLGISMATPLFLETRLPGESFDILGEDLIPIRYYVWREGIESIDESFLTHNLLFVNKNYSIRDFCQDIFVNMSEKGLVKEGDDFNNIIIFKEKYGSSGVFLTDLTAADIIDKSVEANKVMEGARIFVDFKKPDDSITNWQREFDLQTNRYCIRFNDPNQGPADQWANEEYRSIEGTYSNNIFLEAGQTCLELKMKIADVIKIDITEFRMMKSGIKYEEIKDLSQTLYEANLYKNSKIFIELGKPTSLGSVKVNIYEATFNQVDDDELFKYSDLLFELTIEKDSSVRDFKSRIAEEYTKTQTDSDGNPKAITRDMVRIRDKGIDRLGKIMRDGKKVSNYDICQNKAYAIQVLDYEEQISDDMDMMLVIREWLPGENGGTLTPKKEVLLNRKMRSHEISEALKNTGHIPDSSPTEHYDICKVSSISRFSIKELPGEKWVQLNSNGGMTTLDGHPLYIRSDGYLVIIRNRESFKAVPIVKDDTESLAVGSIADSITSKYDKFDVKSSATHRLPYVGGSGGYKQKGVTIQVMDKKAQEEAEKKKQEEEDKKNQDMEVDDDGTQVMAESKQKKTKTTTQSSAQQCDMAVDTSDPNEVEVVNADADIDFLFDLEDA